MPPRADVDRIESLRKRLGARTKIEVVRTALDLLEQRAERLESWHRAAKLAATESRAVNRAFRPGSRLHRIA